MHYLSIGLLIGIVIGASIPALGNKANIGSFTTRGLSEQIRECQKDLPRTEHCVLVAVPENEMGVVYHKN